MSAKDIWIVYTTSKVLEDRLIQIIHVMPRNKVSGHNTSQD